MQSVEELRQIVVRLNLYRDILFDSQCTRSLAAVYNGCGPEWSPVWVRRELTRRFRYFEAAFLIHDWDFAYAERTRAAFKAANKRMLKNCRKLIKVAPFWLRPVLYVDAQLLYWAVSSKRAWKGFCDDE